jgi:hypothetical protein
MVYFQTKNPNLGQFLRALSLENVGIFYGHLEYLSDIWKFNDHLVRFVLIWYIYPNFGIMYQENLATLSTTRNSVVRHKFKGFIFGRTTQTLVAQHRFTFKCKQALSLNYFTVATFVPSCAFFFVACVHTFFPAQPIY